jgi:hypothetical protein
MDEAMMHKWIDLVLIPWRQQGILMLCHCWFLMPIVYTWWVP